VLTQTGVYWQCLHFQRLQHVHLALLLLLLLAQVFNKLGTGSTSSIVSAINWLANNGRASKIRVANMSLGGPSSVAVCNAVYWAIRSGITFVVAAGGCCMGVFCSRCSGSCKAPVVWGCSGHDIVDCLLTAAAAAAATAGDRSGSSRARYGLLW
jgi:hypothetical protein